jgi:hypothetical protein
MFSVWLVYETILRQLFAFVTPVEHRKQAQRTFLLAHRDLPPAEGSAPPPYLDGGGEISDASFVVLMLTFSVFCVAN